MGQIEEILRSKWGYPGFRPFQREIITSLMSGKDTLALMPTGGGKSLCYQVPALAMEGFCLVITPLVALMQDQVKRLNELEIPAACIHAGMGFLEVRRTFDNMVHGPFKLLYISPERLQSGTFREYLPEFNISFLAVDEAHCISRWGHDFRPDYLKISWLREVFTDIPILALTATATDEIRKDIITYLRLKEPVIYKDSFRRSNIFYEIQYSENKAADTLKALQRQNGSTIIYCRSRKQTEAVARTLTDHHIPAMAYHAGMKREKRDEAQRAWMNDEIRVMVATTAFGMGIDKPDVRLVLHYDAPEDPESFYQESGRAGRDGKPAMSICLYNSTDLRRLEESTALRFPPEAYLRKTYQSVAEYLQVPVTAEPDKYYPFDLGEFAARFGFQAVPASYALKLLEQEGLWTLSDAIFNASTIEFLAGREELDAIGRIYPDLAIVITGLLRMYGTLFYHPTSVSLPAIAKQLKIKKELAGQLIVQMDKMQVLEYRKPREGSQLYFHHRRVDSDHLLLDLNRIHVLRSAHEKRTKAITGLLTGNNVCREQYLLRYFNEHTEEVCGHCDICRDRLKARSPIPNLRGLIRFLMQDQALSLPAIMQALPDAHQDQIIETVRLMMDEGIIIRNNSGQFMLNKI